MSASPLKRRAALATLDANAMTPTTSTTTPASAMDHGTSPIKAAGKTSGVADTTSTSSFTPSGTKRPQQQQQHHHQYQQDSPAAKKSRLEDAGSESAAPSTQDSSRSRTHSPDASSVFDTSAAEDASWSTTATEPDVQLQLQQMQAVIPGARARGVPLTREQAREKAEILRLRLGLASYKLRTGQISIPLADLQAKPLLARYSAAAANHAAAAAAATAAATTVSGTPESSQEEQDNDEGQKQNEEDDDGDVIAATPPSQQGDAAPVAGGAAVTGLLSLAMGSR